jgi:hypothetical protein
MPILSGSLQTVLQINFRLPWDKLPHPHNQSESLMPQKFEKPATGRPATGHEFVEALFQGDASKTETVLRHLRELGPDELQILADCFSEDAALKKLIPYRLKFVQRGRGRPGATIDRLKKAAEDRCIRLAYEDARPKHKKFESAVNEVIQKTKFKRTRVTKVLAEHK